MGAEEYIKGYGLHAVDPDALNSAGEVDDRRPISTAEREYDSVVHIKGSYGGNSYYCTGTISDLEGFDLTQPGSLVTTAAHCLDPEPHDDIPPVDPADITIQGSYRDQSGFHQFTMEAAETWTNPGYYSPDGKVGMVSDTALIRTKMQAPAEVTPALTNTYGDLLKGKVKEGELVRIKGEVQGLKVAGYSVDKQGLYEDPDASGVLHASTQGLLIISDADVAGGASGGPVFGGADNSGMRMTEEGRPLVVGVMKGMYGEDGQAVINTFSEQRLQDVPFLEPTDGEADLSSEPEGTEQELPLAPKVSPRPLAKPEFTGPDPLVDDMLQKDAGLFTGTQEGPSAVTYTDPGVAEESKVAVHGSPVGEVFQTAASEPDISDSPIQDHSPQPDLHHSPAFG